MSTTALPKMVPAAFLSVVLIWSTTPLGIVWSSESVHPTMAVLLRMLIALTLGALIILIARIRLPWSATARRLYAVSSIGIVGGMLLSYFAARYIPSGIMSLIFGLSPLISGLLAQKILNEPKFGPMRLVALVMAFIGLGIVCSSKLSLESDSWIGLLLILSAVSLFSLSGVLIKTVKINIHPIASTVGALIYSTPMFALAWLLFDGTLPIETWQPRSLLAITYLGVFGSLIGFISYFYILQHLNASTVALVTLITPVFAMMLGAQLNGEAITQALAIGACFVLTGLALYQFGDPLLNKLSKKRACRKR
ncbi:EamA family transporter [Shewanella sp. Choline-02u-19]|uniref:DMT family transporter n=1 Tax=unclassified Shewanella TaxID=196818 RepID=UPI000C345214|nr:MULTISPECIES: DMT family transporter [unclassified Shewanella]PKH56709.1 EamA family transporter [Shewanella sp. Bg11-22]PKI30260.1 EamA family transporter [Shewanella sp. Choline-02u-19]